MTNTIKKVEAYEVLDSRGFPTVKVSLTLEDGSVGKASVPSGASTGQHEAVEFRDNDSTRYLGKGVKTAIKNINEVIFPAVTRLKNPDLWKVDSLLMELDGTKNKSNLGANATLAVSLAFSKAMSNFYKIPLFRYLGGFSAKKMPIPMMNILNGGVHAFNNLDIQEFMITPVTAISFTEGVRWCSEIYHTLGQILKENDFETSVGDEGGFAPNLTSNEEAIELIIAAINRAGYNTNEVKIALDAASSQWYLGNSYTLTKSQKTFTSQEMVEYWSKLCEKYPIISLEDAMSEQDYDGWEKLTLTLGNKVQLVGDDLFVTNAERLKQWSKQNLANSILIKPNQIGTLSETFETIETAKSLGYTTIVSHRSGETEDTSIADIAVATNSWQIKAGAPCRSERTSKYNRLMEIENWLNTEKSEKTFFNNRNEFVKNYTFLNETPWKKSVNLNSKDFSTTRRGYLLEV